MCKSCGFHSHSTSLQNYYMHISTPEGSVSACEKRIRKSKEDMNVIASKSQTKVSAEDEKKCNEAYTQFMRKTVPILVVLSGMSHGSASKFLVAYETHRPVMSFNAAKLVTRTCRTWNLHDQALANDLWKIIRDEVTKRRLFGVAIDAAVDRVLARFILIMVLYVGNLVFELPPIYEPQGAAFNGITVGRAMFDCLTLHLGVVQGADGPLPLSARCRYLMVDGCGVNHCARKELTALLESYLKDNFGALGDVDYSNMRQAFRLKAHTLWLLTCVGHFIDVPADTMKHWDGTLLFEIRKLFMHLFYGGKNVSAKKGRYRGADLDVAAAKDVNTIIKEKQPFRAAVVSSGMTTNDDNQ